jgi:hypothetical protein
LVHLANSFPLRDAVSLDYQHDPVQIPVILRPARKIQYPYIHSTFREYNKLILFVSFEFLISQRDSATELLVSIRQVYISFAKEYIQAQESLDIISAPQMRCRGPLEAGKHLPSWCPDWRARSHVNSFLRPDVLPIIEIEDLGDLDVPLYSAASSTKAVTSFFEEDELLVCSGMIVDTVIQVSGKTFDPNEWFELAKARCHNSSVPLAEEKVNRDFWSMMFGDPTSSWSLDADGKSLLMTASPPAHC